VPTTGSLGQIVTFYSYKGGTGRTMALANIAYILTKNMSGKSVLMVDWDLEAPGLHRYVRDLMRGHVPNDQLAAKKFDDCPGLIDLFQEIKRLVDSGQAPKSALSDLQLDRFILQTDVPGLHLIKAGRFDAGYSAAVNTFQWEGMHTRAPWVFEALGRRLAERYDYVLIDSRTGLTDTSGICTSILPDTLVIVFTPNRQSLLGALDMAQSAGNYRKDSDDLRPLRILPLPSRIEAAEPSLRERWRFGDIGEDIPGYQPSFENLFSSLYGLPSCDLAAYFTEVQIQHLPRFAYGEEIAARVEPADRLSLTRSFEHFLKWIVSFGVPWEELSNAPEEECTQPARDQAWLLQKRITGERGLQKLGANGFMEASFFLSKPLDAATSPRLFQAAQAAQVPGTGWPIGAVLGIATESRPHPTPDGLSAEIVDESTKSYDYWALRTDGSFYFFRNLEEESEYLLTDDRVARVAELLYYCQRLYTFLGAERSAQVLVSVSFGGLAGRALGCRTPDASEVLQRLTGACAQDKVESEVLVELASIQRDIDHPVEVLTTPLFAIFDFYQLPADERKRLISKNLVDWGFGEHAESSSG
jgi:cellulose biosynthesis protein BcsQ